MHKILIDLVVSGKLDDPEREIQRAGELRDLLTSLGPFFSIKIGQASLADLLLLYYRCDCIAPTFQEQLHTHHQERSHKSVLGRELAQYPRDLGLAN